MANGITEEEGDKRRAILLSFCGAATYQLIRNLVAPNKPTEKTFSDLVTLVKDHYQPRPSTIVQRFNFHMRTQKPGETISDFVAQLRKISEYCEFGDALQDMLRDRLVCGCKDQRLQCKLLAESELSFEKAFKIAKAMEAAEKEAKDLQDTPGTPVNRLSRGPISKPTTRNNLRLPHQAQRTPVTPSCYRCGAKHKASDCKFRDAECHFCKKKGHIAKMCRSKAKMQQNQTRTNQLHSTETPGDETLEYSLFHTQGQKSPAPIQITLAVNGADLSMELDTGATLSIISEETYRKLFSAGKAPTLKASKAQLKTYTGEVIQILGEIEVKIQYKGQEKKLNLLVVAGKGPSLLGRDWLNHIKLDWSQLNHLHTSATSTSCQQIFDRHKTVFEEGLGKVEGTTAKFHINPDIQPRFYKTRPVPYALQPRVEAALRKLEADGV